MAPTEAFYLKHDLDARDHDKMRPLIMKHGAAGYGVYWWIVEDLYKNKGRLARDYAALAWAYHEPEKLVKAIVEDFGAFYDDAGRIACRRVDRDLASRREAAAQASAAGKASAAKRALNGRLTVVEENPTTVQPGEERRGEEGKERNLTAANGSPSAADLKKEIEKTLNAGERTQFLARMADARLPFDFGDFKKGGRIDDLPAETCALVLEKVPRLGLDLRRFLQIKIDDKKADSNRRKS